MRGLFLHPEAASLIRDLEVSDVVKGHAIEVLSRGYTVIRRAVSQQQCGEVISAFRRLEQANQGIFSENRDARGHYPRIVNLHCVLPELTSLFTRNETWLQVQDVLFGAPTALYTSLFYEVGSQQPLHRDTPVFTTRPEYLYFGTTIYLERADDENGCLEVMEGGHLMPELDREAMALARYGSLDAIPAQDNAMWSEYQDTVAAEGKRIGLSCKRLYVEAGDSLIWHPQLPHGGTPIKDARRTRFSFVMHTTPVDTAVHHQDAFFHPTKEFPSQAPWSYREVDGRLISDFQQGISFGHVRDYKREAFSI